MTKKDLITAMKLLSSHGVGSFESSLMALGQHTLSVKFLDGNYGFFKRLSEVQAWIDIRALDNPILSTIARSTLGIETLAAQNSDSLDFHEIHVLSLKKALRDAFEAGARSVQSNS